MTSINLNKTHAVIAKKGQKQPLEKKLSYKEARSFFYHGVISDYGPQEIPPAGSPKKDEFRFSLMMPFLRHLKFSYKAKDVTSSEWSDEYGLKVNGHLLKGVKKKVLNNQYMVASGLFDSASGHLLKGRKVVVENNIGQELIVAKFNGIFHKNSTSLKHGRVRIKILKDGIVTKIKQRGRFDELGRCLSNSL